MGMQSTEIKQTAVRTLSDIYSTIIVNVFYDLFKHRAEKIAEQSQCQNTTLLHIVDDGGEASDVTVQRYLASLVFVQLDNHDDELWWPAKAHHDHP